MEKIKCVVPNCKCTGEQKHMWLPEWSARKRANNGKYVGLAQYPEHALCGRHGHLLRKKGVRVYRYLDEVTRENARLEKLRRQEQSQFGTFADLYVEKPRQNGSNGQSGSAKPDQH